jgi:LacI family transcriptional regulator
MIPRRATITDVARLAGVSIKTVSRVLNNEPHVRPSTRDKVIAAAESLSYLPNLSARQLASSLTFVIGMLYDNPNSAYVTDVQNGSLRACREHGYNLLIHPCQVGSTDLIDEVSGLHRQVDGLILLQPISDIRELCEVVLEHQIECVRVSQRPHEGIPWISVGDSEAADDMTEYLLELGHRRIGFIIGHPDHGSSHDRLAGYRRALQRHDIDFADSLVEQGRFDYESG